MKKNTLAITLAITGTLALTSTSIYATSYDYQISNYTGEELHLGDTYSRYSDFNAPEKIHMHGGIWVKVNIQGNCGTNHREDCPAEGRFQYVLGNKSNQTDYCIIGYNKSTNYVPQLRYGGNLLCVPAGSSGRTHHINIMKK